MLRGRNTECRRLDALITDMRTGHSRTLVVRGETGVGKSALLDYAAERASGCRVARAVGVEAEMELAFAGLHQLCGPMLDHLDRLPGPQHEALCVTFGLEDGSLPDRLLVGLAVLSLLSDVAEERPLVCLVDDAQWLDRASVQALTFVARRPLADPVALVFAMREPSQERQLDDLPDMVVEGISDHDARQLLASSIPGRVDERVRERIIAETHGNPLALLELPRGRTPAELAGGFWLPDDRPMSTRIEQSFQRQVEALPPDTRRLLLTAAADPVGDVTLLWRAADQLGIGASAADPAEAAGVIEVGARLRFRHPLVRSATYRAAGTRDRQEVHRALAAATDPHADPDRRAWHRAQATVEPDEAVAAELAASADRAQARGGFAAAAAFLERATGLTPDPARRGARALAAAEAKLDAAAPDAASDLLANAEICPLDELQRVRLERLRAGIVFTRSRGSDAPPLLAAAAKRLAPLDARLARETYLDALGAAVVAGHLSGRAGMATIAAAARSAPPAPDPPRGIDLLLDGLIIRCDEGYRASAPALRRAIEALCRETPAVEDVHWLELACRMAADLWDLDAGRQLADRQERLARDAGALGGLAVALVYQAGLRIHAGEFAAARAFNDEAETISQATGAVPLRYANLLLAAWRGQEGQTADLIEATVRDARARGEGRAISVAECSRAIVDNGLGRYDNAAVAARSASERRDVMVFGLALIELIEATARSGRVDEATEALAQLSEQTAASGTDWALGAEARSRAMLSGGHTAEALYQEAIERFARGGVVAHVARGELLYGEWLRREGRRVDAREHLRRAHQMFIDMGAAAFAERARHELVATGETVRKRTVETQAELTAQEAQIARLARDGHTNPEIATQLFISARTVEWHLRKVFTKLGITSRKDLRRAVLDGHPAPATG
jgi:DNA-binding NarL/FixJ family response regulator